MPTLIRTTEEAISVALPLRNFYIRMKGQTFLCSSSGDYVNEHMELPIFGALFSIVIATASFRISPILDMYETLGYYG